MGRLLHIIYINDLAENLPSNPKLFAGDFSLFSLGRDLNIPANEINDVLKKIELWVHQCKMSFNPAPFRQAHEVIFSRRRIIGITEKNSHHPDIIFKGNLVKSSKAFLGNVF